jgi:hypothetical protein
MLTASAHLIDLMVPDALCRAVDAKIKKERDRFDLCFDHSAKRFEARWVDAIRRVSLSNTACIPALYIFMVVVLKMMDVGIIVDNALYSIQHAGY